ncbi:hypothetical protein Patl1_30126 [Pistacia atlantica]|uniref:Uncharacterized protein n=1 Tax=Pistacia atlantica TaxID=434234 RepID=A0ACC1ABW3_9ROSI|nr:hypothetical protein Patl1_30126 [Pistacia atlantica]
MFNPHKMTQRVSMNRQGARISYMDALILKEIL